MSSLSTKIVNTANKFPDLIKQLNILFEKNLFKDSLELIELNLKQNSELNNNPDFLNIYGLIQLNLKDQSK